MPLKCLYSAQIFKIVKIWRADSEVNNLDLKWCNLICLSLEFCSKLLLKVIINIWRASICLLIFVCAWIQSKLGQDNLFRLNKETFSDKASLPLRSLLSIFKKIRGHPSGKKLSSIVLETDNLENPHKTRQRCLVLLRWRRPYSLRRRHLLT